MEDNVSKFLVLWALQPKNSFPVFSQQLQVLRTPNVSTGKGERAKDKTFPATVNVSKERPATK